MHTDFNAIRAELLSRESQHDESSWPQPQLDVLSRHGCWRYAIPRDFGGLELPPVERLRFYEAVAAGSLSVALVLTQHDGATAIIARAADRRVADELLARAATGELLLTVGISQLTTSQGHGGPAMRAVPCDGGYALDGLMPWVTSVRKADGIVVGAVLPDEQQLLGYVPTDAAGLEQQEPLSLMALSASWTGGVRCHGVHVAHDQVLRGPAPEVLAHRAPVKPLTVSSVGVGAAGAMVEYMHELAASLPEARALLERGPEETYHRVRTRLYDATRLIGHEGAHIPGVEIRNDVNDLVVRLAATIMTLAKGTGFAASHRAQKLVREAMFFLVWSAPAAVRLGTLERIWRKP